MISQKLILAGIQYDMVWEGDQWGSGEHYSSTHKQTWALKSLLFKQGVILLFRSPGVPLHENTNKKSNSNYATYLGPATFPQCNSLFTPRVSDGCNSFDIVCPSVCVGLCASVTTLMVEKKYIPTWFLVCRSNGKITKSSSKVRS